MVYVRLGMGHVIAGAGLGRGLALHGADVLNVWRPSEFEEESLLSNFTRWHAFNLFRY
jgi:crotonobetainyl-CoA:carnitine CoA-transferase CaiB-like acyl-CoA transferase